MSMFRKEDRQSLSCGVNIQDRQCMESVLEVKHGTVDDFPPSKVQTDSEFLHLPHICYHSFTEFKLKHFLTKYRL